MGQNGSLNQTISYDHDGNRLAYTDYSSNTASTSTYRADDSMATSVSKGVTYTSVHDPVGRVIGDGCSTYSFDGFDRQSGSAAGAGRNSNCGPDPGATSYQYDGLDRRRVSITSAGATYVDYQGMGTNVEVEQKPAATGGLTFYELDDRGKALAAVSGGGMNKQWFGYDQQGSLGIVLDKDRNIQCNLRLDPYGSPMSAQSASNPCNGGSTISDLIYHGGRRDATTGQYELGSRTLDPSRGSFLSPDSYRFGSPSADAGLGADPATANRYLYVNSDPLNLSDPSGHNACRTEGVGSGGCSRTENADLAASDAQGAGGCGAACYAYAGSGAPPSWYTNSGHWAVGHKAAVVAVAVRNAVQTVERAMPAPFRGGSGGGAQTPDQLMQAEIAACGNTAMGVMSCINKVADRRLTQNAMSTGCLVDGGIFEAVRLITGTDVCAGHRSSGGSRCSYGNGWMDAAPISVPGMCEYVTGMARGDVIGATGNAIGDAEWTAAVSAGSLGAGALADGAAAAAVEGGAADGAAADSGALDGARAVCGGESFSANSQVLLANGATMAISRLKVGDQVMATDLRTGKTQAETVSTVWVHEDRNLMDVMVKTASGAAAIHSTSNHLFWDRTSRAWTEAGTLRVGDELFTPDGRLATVAALDWVPGTEWMWDLTVENDHDFFVTVASSAVLVHNCAMNGSPQLDPGAFAGKTPQEIDQLAQSHGLIPRGPDPMGGRGAYIDPVTGEQRVLIHPNDLNGPAMHVNDPWGRRLDINGNSVGRRSPAAHLPLRW